MTPLLAKIRRDLNRIERLLFGRRPTYIPRNHLDALCVPLLLNGSPFLSSVARTTEEAEEQEEKEWR
ncbi:hypothetical protein Dimus_030073, partial [Dionaea muscipula]